MLERHYSKWTCFQPRYLSSNNVNPLLGTCVTSTNLCNENKARDK